MAVTPLNEWRASETRTRPAQLAREVRREWERFVVDGRAERVRAPVLASWERSLVAGVDPSGSRLAPTAAAPDEVATRWETHPLSVAAPLIRHALESFAGDSDHLIVVSDANGLLLALEGDARVRSQAADTLNFTEGALWSEDDSGTNAVGTALAADHAVEIFAGEHFVEVVQPWTCAAAPVHDPETGDLLGVIDLTGLCHNVEPHSLAVVVAAARAVESHLRQLLRDQDARLRKRYDRQLTETRGRRALLTRSGRVLSDDGGWLAGTRFDVPPDGGELLLPAGERGYAESLDHDAYLLRELTEPRLRPTPLPETARALADEQAALRRLATAVAGGGHRQDIFAAIAAELGPLLGGEDATVVRYEPEGAATIVAGVGPCTDVLPHDRRVALDDTMAITTVFRTRRSARQDDDLRSRASGPVADDARHPGRSTVASPVMVDGRLWGAVVVSTTRGPLPADAERRMAGFAELVGIVIATAESRAELSASRARVVAAGDDALRRIRRDLHDGAQRGLVNTIVTLTEARKELEAAGVTGPARELVDEALAHARTANYELRELAHGILPSALTRGGLRGGIEALVSRARLPVSVEVTAQRLPPALEATAYFIVAEALTNAVRHAEADEVQICATIDGSVLRVAVRDDGVGGARCDASTGLLGLRDRAAAHNGELRVVSPPGRGTLVAATLPIADARAA
ncbi:GAF domain-containing protein [Solirubrobacter ginsenosidimutans]|uniref:histidine kinase n=1 Tax=Solirubrobacter ginsenosidimutans TaxID=490573 RepID=A0A9X3S1A2_9ACTN|nr:GAF domain-containing protein [Solirubrobacter ginsenosidimutans]MDA0159946.1 GAF domain-containing protein [Solirubrobacter ginsenosidimutans]